MENKRQKNYLGWITLSTLLFYLSNYLLLLYDTGYHRVLVLLGLLAPFIFSILTVLFEFIELAPRHLWKNVFLLMCIGEFFWILGANAESGTILNHSGGNSFLLYSLPLFAILQGVFIGIFPKIRSKLKVILLFSVISFSISYFSTRLINVVCDFSAPNSYDVVITDLGYNQSNRGSGLPGHFIVFDSENEILREENLRKQIMPRRDWGTIEKKDTVTIYLYDGLLGAKWFSVGN